MAKRSKYYSVILPDELRKHFRKEWEKEERIFNILMFIIVLLFLFLLGYLLFRTPKTLEIKPERKENIENQSKFILISNLQNISEVKNENKEEVLYRIVTAYSSRPEETDDTPFITASGQRVRYGICATNEFPFGTILKLGDIICEVQDRTNKRYKYRIDIWMPTTEKALEFGKKILPIKVLKMGK
jgi:3D (Asp-Asp-Asp) domain-containing protein